MVNEWSVCDSIVKKVIGVYNKYLRSGNYKEGSSESQKRILGCPSEKHSYDNKTGLEDLFVAVGVAGTHARNDSMLRHPGEHHDRKAHVITQ